jgi:hypothetical protein
MRRDAHDRQDAAHLKAPEMESTAPYVIAYSLSPLFAGRGSG